MKRILLAGAIALGLAAPAVADTLQEVTTKGIILTIEGLGEFPVKYMPDGTFSVDFQGQTMLGKWRIDGTKLCSTSDVQPDEQCVEYPTGKKSGDEFDVTGPAGTAKVKIN